MTIYDNNVFYLFTYIFFVFFLCFLFVLLFFDIIIKALNNEIMHQQTKGLFF